MPFYLAIAPYPVIFILGACFYSFLNVVVLRYQRGLSFVHGRSRCPSCGHALSPFDLIPVLSWLFLRGRCRYCGARISARYFAMETLGGTLAVLCFLSRGIDIRTAALFFLLCAMTVCAFLAHDTGRFPTGAALAVLFFAFLLCLLDSSLPVWERLCGAAVCALPLLFRMRGGRAEAGAFVLACACGAAMGLWGSAAALLLSCFSALTCSILTKHRLNDAVSFSCGAAAALLLSGPLTALSRYFT